jgi:hypothetical protein
MGADLAGAQAAAVTDLAGEVGVTLLSVVVATVSADSTAAALVRDSGERGDFLLVAFPVGEIKVVLATVVSVDASATFAGVASARLMEAFSISASMGMDIRIITHTTTRITIRTLLELRSVLKGSTFFGVLPFQIRDTTPQLCNRALRKPRDING